MQTLIRLLQKEQSDQGLQFAIQFSSFGCITAYNAHCETIMFQYGHYIRYSQTCLKGHPREGQRKAA